MSFLGSAGSTGGSGRTQPPAPTNVLITRNVVDYDANPSFTLSWTNSTVAGKCNYSPPRYFPTLSWASTSQVDAVGFITLPQVITISKANITLGTAVTPSLYVRDACGNISTTASGTAVTALTKPAVPSSLTISGGAGTISGSWSLAGNGGATATFSWAVYNTSNQLQTSSSGATNTSFSLSNIAAGNYYFTVSATNTLGTSNSATSSIVAVSAPGPYFPYFPYFPFFPSFGGGCRPPCNYPSFCAGSSCVCC